ncbi:MAG: hypothetical protein AAB669_00115 [Patescibacteria group bacterium]
MKTTIWWVGLTLFVLGTLGAFAPPENYPGWWAKAWGMTFPYQTDATKTQSHDPAVAGQIWTGRGLKGVGGNTRLELEQPALRKEAAAGDARVDGRAQHRVYLVLVAVIGLFLMYLGLRQEDREREERRFERLEGQLPNQTTPDSTKTSVPSQPTVSQGKSTPLEPMNDDPEPNWWQLLWAPWRRTSRERQSVIAAPTEPIDINIVVESFDGDKSKARHVLTASLPAMTVHSVKAHLRVGTNDTVQEMGLDVH